MAILSTSDAYEGVYTKNTTTNYSRRKWKWKEKSKDDEMLRPFSEYWICYALFKSMAVDFALDGDSSEWWI